MVNKTLINLLIVGVLLLVGTTSCSPLEEATITEAQTTEDGSKTIEKIGMTVTWKVMDTNIAFTVTAPTTGWIAIGFDPTSVMKDANIIMGYVSEDTVTITDEYGNSSFTHQVDTLGEGTDNLSEKSGSESDGSTTISFTMPLNSGDSRDKALVVGQDHTFLLAYGQTDDTTEKHQSVGIVITTL